MKAGLRVLFLFAFSSIVLVSSNFAQEKLEDKINKIDGSVDKITITSEGKEYVFEGDEAAELFKKIKNKSSKSFIWNSSDDDKRKKKVILLDLDDEEL